MGMKFYMVFDKKEKLLYISLPAEKLIVKVDPAKNPILINPVAGTGDPCLGNNPCGDEGLAIKAHLTYPKVMVLIWPFLQSFQYIGEKMKM